MATETRFAPQTSPPHRNRRLPPRSPLVPRLSPIAVINLDDSDSDAQARRIKAPRTAMTQSFARDQAPPIPSGTLLQPFLISDSGSGSEAEDSKPPGREDDADLFSFFDAQGTALPFLQEQDLDKSPDIHTWTPDKAIIRLRELFPDIDRDFVQKHYYSCLAHHTHGEALLAEIVEHISDENDYPKQKKQQSKSAQPDHLNPVGCRWGEAPWDSLGGLTGLYARNAMAILVTDFSGLNAHSLRRTLRDRKCLYAAYIELADPANELATAAFRLRNPRPRHRHTARDYVQTLLTPAYGERLLRDELAAAQKEVASRTVIADAVTAEAQNLADAKTKGLLGECACCFDDEVPLNRITHCSAAAQHFYCYGCTKKNTETMVGKGEYRPVCIDTSGCQAPLDISQLNLCLDAATLAVLQRKQQVDEVQKACPDIVDCPFCDYMADCPPAEVDREFVCRNDECAITSCRLCRAKSHVPLNCEEYATKKDADKKLDHRHILEEAMTEALVRTCNTCKNRFVKEDGCNKMRCPKCLNLQCYACGDSIKGYEHFGSGKKCPMHDNFGVEIRHADEVKKAEEAVRKKIREANTDLSDADLEIKVSDEVRNAEEQNMRVARGEGARGNPGNLYPGFFAPGRRGVLPAFPDPLQLEGPLLVRPYIPGLRELGTPRPLAPRRPANVVPIQRPADVPQLNAPDDGLLFDFNEPIWPFRDAGLENPLQGLQKRARGQTVLTQHHWAAHGGSDQLQRAMMAHSHGLPHVQVQRPMDVVRHDPGTQTRLHGNEEARFRQQPQPQPQGQRQGQGQLQERKLLQQRHLLQQMQQQQRQEQPQWQPGLDHGWPRREERPRDLLYANPKNPMPRQQEPFTNVVQRINRDGRHGPDPNG